MKKCVHVWIVGPGPGHVNFACELCNMLIGVFITPVSSRPLVGDMVESTVNFSARLVRDTGTRLTVDDMVLVASMARHMFMSHVRSEQASRSEKKRHKKRRVA